MTTWTLAHLGKKAAGKYPDQMKAWWLCRTNPRARISNPPKDGISETDLLAALGSFEPDEQQYLSGSRQILICDRDQEEFWLKRILSQNEDVADWKIVLLVNEMCTSGPTGWKKVIIKNMKTGKYSGRSIHKLTSLTPDQVAYFGNKLARKRVAALAQDPKWFIEWTKPAADKTFWIKLKSMLIRQ